jgi:signal transduction histidine kinase
MMKLPLLIFLTSLICTSYLFAQQSKNGLIDLRNRPSDVSRLDGEWKFHFGAFLDSAQTEEAKYQLFKNPGVWNGIEWEGKRITGKGYGTFWLDILLPENWDVIGIKIPTIGTSGAVYINDRQVYQEGVPGINKAATVPDYDIGFVHFPLHPNQRKIRLILHVANYHYAKGGIWSSFFISDSPQIDRKMHVDHITDAFLLGVFAIMFLYHISLFSMRPRERFTLYFGLLCFLIFFRTLCTGDYYINQFIPFLPWVAVIKIEFITFFLSVTANILFVRSLFPQETPKGLFHFMAWPGPVLALMTVVTQPEVNSHFINPFQVYLISSTGGLIYILIRAVKNDRSGSQIFLFGLLIAALAMINDILYFNYIWRTFIMIHIGVFFYIFSLSFLVARRYSGAMNEVEELTEELSFMNKELENKVHERTSNIQEQNRLINDQNKELKKLYAEQKNLIAVVAHDLKSPFHKIKGLLSIIDISGPLNKDQKEAYERMDEITEEGSELINDLTNLNAYEQPEFEPNYEDVELSSFIAEIVNGYKLAASAKDIDLYIVGCDEPYNVHTDKKMLRRIIDNLMSNAIKFSPPRRSVFVSLYEGQENFEISIRDEGVGFTDDDKEKIFRKFQKLSAQPTGGESSTGLGLSIVKALTDRLKGTVDLQSEVNKGSKFTVNLPVKP